MGAIFILFEPGPATPFAGPVSQRLYVLAATVAAVEEVARMLDYVVKSKASWSVSRTTALAAGKFFRIGSTRVITSSTAVASTTCGSAARTSAPKLARSFATWTAGDSRASPVFFL